jgi:hypothetical protein
LDIVKWECDISAMVVHFNEAEITNADYVALISDKVAQQNNIFVGDVIYLQNTFSMWKEDNTDGRNTNVISR